jgi:hypothetical protein
VNGFTLHANHDATVGEGVGQSANGGHDLWAPTGKRVKWVTWVE